MSKISGFTDTISFGDLVSENITIPEYQRAYVWDSERVKILLEDLDAQMSDSQKSAESNKQKIFVWEFDFMRKSQSHKSKSK